MNSFFFGGNSTTLVDGVNKAQYVSNDHCELAFWGWATIDGATVKPESFLSLFEERKLSKLQAGTFIAVVHVKSNNSIQIINDPFGISSHYYRFKEGTLELSPTTSAFSNKIIDESLVSFERQQGHLIGNFTRYKDIFRVPPGSVLSCDGSLSYYSGLGHCSAHSCGDVREVFSQSIQAWTYSERVIPLSSGFDSRLIASCGEFKYGYTYGERDSDDCRIGQKISFTCDDYFQFLAPDNDKSEVEFNQYMFDGDVANQVGIYSHARGLLDKKASSDNFTIFDGHLGDALQRGSYLKLGGVFGVIFLLIPALYKLPLSVEFILKRRYKKLDKSSLSLLLNTFRELTKDLNLNDYQKVIYFEALHGRGGRLIVNGGNIQAGQFFTVVSPFAHTEVFNILINQDFTDVVRYRSLKLLWAGASQNFTDVPTESGIKPTSNPALFSFLRVFNAVRQKFVS